MAKEYPIVDSVESFETALARVRAAQKVYATYTQEQVDKIFKAAALAANNMRIPLAKMAVEETGMGVVEDKVIKNHYAAEYIYNAYKDTQTVGVLERDEAFGMMKVAEPIGVVAAVIPTTNPTSTAIFKTLICLKTRNGIIISPHPRAKKSTIAAAKVVLEAAVAAGAPEDIISWVAVPSLELTNMAMKEADIILATGGPGSIDVVEIDAASHNGVDDARELRERAGFAPARDRYKIFILAEAHMVTQQGFNALLKIVEEPPEHVMFIFATTEPDKVIGTIRSRTHHYPFRLVPQEVMGPYLETICDKEGIKPEPGVLKLAMRAGGGSSVVEQTTIPTSSSIQQAAMNRVLLGQMGNSVTDVEIGGGKIQGREIIPGRGQIQFAMYNARQYEKPEGHFTEQTSRDGEKWYKVYATTRVEKTPTVQDERGRMQYDERKVAAMPKAPARRH